MVLILENCPYCYEDQIISIILPQSSMSYPSNPFIKPSLTQRSFMSQNGKKQPFLYSNSSTKIDQCEFEVEKIREKYQRQYNKFYKDRHQRSKSQIAKLDRIIRDANDLNEILNDANKWLEKRNQNQKEKQKFADLNFTTKPPQQSTTVRWKGGKKINL